MAKPGCGTFVAFAILAGGETACLLYTDPINMRPSVTIKNPTDVLKGVPTKIEADALDDDGPESLTFAWRTEGGKCPAEDVARRWAFDTRRRGEVSYEVMPITTDPLCVAVLVADRYGAEAFAMKDIAARNRAPEARIEVLEPMRPGPSGGYERYGLLRLSGAMSRDPDAGDTITYEWSVIDPAGRALASAKECAEPPRPPRQELCFRTDDEGAYGVRLVVTDDEGAKGEPALREVKVDPDRAPCIVATDPGFRTPRILRAPEEDVRLAVTYVDDDGDPYPAPGGGIEPGRFVWSRRIVGESTTFSRLPRETAPDLSLAKNTFRPGQAVQVRVEYRDRIERDLSSCKDEALCEIKAGTGCYQWVTWTVDYRLESVLP